MTTMLQKCLIREIFMCEVAWYVFAEIRSPFMRIPRGLQYRESAMIAVWCFSQAQQVNYLISIHIVDLAEYIAHVLRHYLCLNNTLPTHN